jgi:hypothetical protein
VKRLLHRTGFLTMPKITPLSRLKTHAFTMVELMIATTITAFAVAAALAFTLQGTKTYFDDANRLSMNHDMRHFTQKLVTDITEANHFFLYRNFTSRIVGGAGTADAYLGQGQSGDFLLLLTLNTTTAGATTVTKMIGYYRDTNGAGNVAPVYRFELDGLSYSASGDPGTPGGTINAMDTLLTTAGITAATQDTHHVFAPSVIGNANDDASLGSSQNPTHLFYDFGGTAVMINGQIQEQGNGNQTKALDTYNLTVLVRG